MATYYAINTGSLNWSSASSWNTASNQSTGNAPNAPLSTDTAILNSFSSNMTVNTASCVCSVLTMTGYTNTFTCDGSNKLTVSGSVTLPAAATLTGTGNLTISGTSTITTNGATWPGSLTLSGASTYSMTGNLTVTGLVTLSAALTFTSASSMTCNGGLTSSAAIVSGTGTFIVGGGTLQSTSAANYFTNNIQLAGNVTLGTNFAFRTRTLTYTSGTITTTGNTLSIGGSCTINTPAASMQWNNIDVTTTSTITLSAALTCNGTFTVGAATTMAGAWLLTAGAVSLEAFTWTIVNAVTVTGTLTVAGAGTITGAYNVSVGGLSLSAALLGTCTILLAGTWSGNYSVTPALTFNGSSTVSGIVAKTSGALTYSSGTITTSGSTLRVLGSFTMNTPTANMSWADITGAATATLTLTNNITLTGTISSGAGYTLTLATSTVTCGGINTNTTGIITGSTINITSGTWQSTSWTTGYVASNLNLDGTVTISGSVGYRTGTLTWVSGTITTTGSTINIGASCTINCPMADMQFNNLTTTSSSTLSLTSKIRVNGNLTSTGLMTLATSDIDLYGNLVSTAGFAGTGRTITMKATSAWSGTGAIATGLTFDASAGTITLPAAMYVSTGVITYTSGTISKSGNTYLYITGAATLDTSGMSWDHVAVDDAAFTISSNLNIDSTFRNSGTTGSTIMSVTGAYTITCNSFMIYNLSAAGQIRFSGGAILKATSSLFINGEAGYTTIQLNSLNPGTPFYLQCLAPIDSCVICGVACTDVDASSSSHSLFTYGGTATNCSNLFAKTPSSFRASIGAV